MRYYHSFLLFHKLYCKEFWGKKELVLSSQEGRKKGGAAWCCRFRTFIKEKPSSRTTFRKRKRVMGKAPGPTRY